MSYPAQHLKETIEIASSINVEDCERCVKILKSVRDRGGRLFILGVGGSAANASQGAGPAYQIGTENAAGTPVTTLVHGGCSSVGRAQDCGSCGRGFDPLQPPQ